MTERQNANEVTRELLRLVAEHPELPIVFFADGESVCGDEFAWYLCECVWVEILEYAIDEWGGDGKVVFKDDEDELVESVAEYKYSGTDEDYERAKEFVAGLWKKAICVRAMTA